jgi:hypothetical protein
LKKKEEANRTSNRPVSQLNEKYKEYLINYFGENSSVFIQNIVDDLTKSFAGFEI